MGCYFLLQGIFLTQESKSCLLYRQSRFFTTDPREESSPGILLPAARCILTDTSPHRAGVRCHHACKALGMLLGAHSILLIDYFHYRSEWLPHPLAERGGAGCRPLVHFSAHPATPDRGSYSHQGCSPSLRWLQPLLQGQERAKEKRGERDPAAWQPLERASAFPG